MKYTIAALILTAAALPTAASARSSSGEATTAAVGAQPGPADPCMLTATVKASYTAAADAEIYGIARKQCGYARAGEADSEAAATWTRLVGDLRVRRRQQNAAFGLREVAAR